jgi:DNA invertase Pin-like site-specific DNA recombinase
MRIALYARTSAADQGQVTTDEILAELARWAGSRGWTVVLRCIDKGPWLQGRRAGLAALNAAIRKGVFDVVIVRSLSQVARSLRHLTDFGQLLARHQVALVAIAESIDTTDPGGALRWQDWLRISATVDRALRSEHTRVAHLRSNTTWGRPMVAVNPHELLTLWEGRAGRRPLAQRLIARKLGVSEATVRARLRELREEGRVDDGARARRLEATGGLNKGGRPAKPLEDDDLKAAWAKYGSRTGVARALRVGRSRLDRRLRELGLIPEETR